jgi:hypothetical protein
VASLHPCSAIVGGTAEPREGCQKVMLSLLLLSLAAAQDVPAASANHSPAENLCRAKLQRRIPGDIGDMTTDSVRKSGRTRTIHGTVTALIGMGEPGPGQASAHHLIRATYRYSCSVRASRVRKTSLTRIE